MTENQRCVRIPLGVIGALGLWLATLVLAVWMTFDPAQPLGFWTVIVADVAAVGTSAVLVSKSVGVIAEIAVRRIMDQIDERRERWVVDTADEVIRLIDLKELEAQVSQLTTKLVPAPRQPSPR